MSKSILSCLSILLLGTSLHAQQPTAPPAPPAPPAHSLRIICVEPAKDAERLIIAEKTEKGWEGRYRFTVARSFMGDPLAFKTQNLALALDPKPAAANSQPGRATPVEAGTMVEPFATLDLPASNKAIAVLTAAADPAKKYRTFLLDTAANRFGAGQILIYNLTSGNIGGVFGGTPLKLASGTQGIITPDVDQPNDMAQITIARQVGEKLIPFCDTRWPVKVEFRRYVLLLQKANGSVSPIVMPEFPPF